MRKSCHIPEFSLHPWMIAHVYLQMKARCQNEKIYIPTPSSATELLSGRGLEALSLSLWTLKMERIE